MQLIEPIISLLTLAAPAAPAVDEFVATAKMLSQYRLKTIIRLTVDQLPLRRAAIALRRRARGPSKLARRLRRRNELGRAGSL
jgi:hypothetical protein